MPNVLEVVAALALSAALMAGCGGKVGSMKMAQLVGDWISEPRETEFGRCTFEITFRADGEVEATMRPTLGGEPISKRGKYSLQKGTLVSQIFNGGQPVPISIEGDTLIINTPGEPPGRLKRKEDRKR
jgi:hypothetical protein